VPIVVLHANSKLICNKWLSIYVCETTRKTTRWYVENEYMAKEVCVTTMLVYYHFSYKLLWPYQIKIPAKSTNYLHYSAMLGTSHFALEKLSMLVTNNTILYYGTECWNLPTIWAFHAYWIIEGLLLSLKSFIERNSIIHNLQQLFIHWNWLYTKSKMTFKSKYSKFRKFLEKW
jgi:hypothetical protein